MGFERYELLRLLSSGPDGVSYLVRETEHPGQLVLRRLLVARAAPERWAALRRQLTCVRALDHAGALPLVAVQLEDDPYLVVPHVPDTLAERLRRQMPDRKSALALAIGLADVLAAAHRLGLTHGRLSAEQVLLQDDKPLLDLTGVRGDEPAPGDGEPAAEPTTAPEDDVLALGQLLSRLLGAPAPAEDDAPTGIFAPQRLDALVGEMLDPDPSARPTMGETLARLRRSDSPEGATRLTSSPVPPSSHSPEIPAAPRSEKPRELVGRFRLLDLLGEGGMGEVFRASDTAGGPDVALKLLRARWAGSRDALRRFYREARLLAGVSNPHIARFIEVNEDRGLHYLAMEFVDGVSLAKLLESERRLPIEQALGISCDVARALVDVHELGVVHRDVKPSNVLLCNWPPQPERPALAKLCDFGIARELAEQGEDLTAEGVAVGTPQYMSPEQCLGAPVDARSDVYSLGIMLFKMLTGQVPFNAADGRSIVLQHVRREPPDVRALRADVSEELARVIARTLAKVPDDRCGGGRDLLEELERLQRGESRDIGMLPHTPEGGSIQPVRYAFSWELGASPEELWPHVSNTERLNRAIGLDAVEYRRDHDEGELRTFGRARAAGLTLDWREHPYEWVAPHRMGVVREFQNGPLHWYRSTVVLEAREHGTLLSHTVEACPRGLFGRAAAAVEIGLRARRGLDRVYKRIDAYLTQRRRESPRGAEPLSADPFERAPDLDSFQLERIERMHDRLCELGAPPDVANGLSDFLRAAPAQEVSRIRPRPLARRCGVDERELLRACLHAAKEGALVLGWDVICPHCRVASSIADSLHVLHEHGYCEACDVDFELDFRSSVELVFRAHPSVRAAEAGTYCIGGPAHTPHVLAQLRLQAGERFVLDTKLDDGSYKLSGRGLPMAWGFRVEPRAPLRGWELSLRNGLPPTVPRSLASGAQRIALSNDLGREVVLRLERGSGREDALTAAEAACSPAFRELFPTELLSSGQLIGVSSVSLLLIELCEPWRTGESESRVFARVNELCHAVEPCIHDEGGAIVKLHGNGVMATFPDPVAAVRAGMRLSALPEAREARLCVHSGAAMATTINARLDYFGRVVHEAAELLQRAAAGELVVSEALYADPGVWTLLGRSSRIVQVLGAKGVVGQAVAPA